MSYQKFVNLVTADFSAFQTGFRVALSVPCPVTIRQKQNIERDRYENTKGSYLETLCKCLLYICAAIM